MATRTDAARRYPDDQTLRDRQSFKAETYHLGESPRRTPSKTPLLSQVGKGADKKRPQRQRQMIGIQLQNRLGKIRLSSMTCRIWYVMLAAGLTFSTPLFAQNAADAVA